MNVLLIAYHFPPDPAVGAIRPARLARALRDRGHAVRVLAGVPSGLPAVGEFEGILVERLEPWLDPRLAWARWQGRNRAIADKEPDAKAGAASWTPPAHMPTWKRHLLAGIWLPDDRQGWMAAVARRGRALVRDGVDVIYTTAPPFSAHLAGLLIRRSASRTRWFAEFRDPWTDNPWKPAFVRTRWSDAADRWLERACLRRADRVVSVTEAAGELFRARLPGRSAKVMAIRNGIESIGAPEPEPGPGNGRILYVGNLYHARDPRPFLRAVAKLKAESRLPVGAGVDFVGNCSHYQGVDLARFIADAGLAADVQLHAPVPHDVCLGMIREASVLLLLAQDQPLQVPNKLYEYLGTGRPILAVADAEGETALMLREAGEHPVVDGKNSRELEEAVLRALTMGRDTESTKPRIPEHWSSEAQLAILIDAIEGRDDGVG